MKNRLLSLDIFRGSLIAFMILVNNPGSWASIYYPLRHAEWHGCTPTDLVFPAFLFIVGVSMYLSFEQFQQQFTKPLFIKILKRTFVIFTLGLFLNWFPFYHQNITDLRIMGVLQRIALAYFFASFICLNIQPKRLIILSFGVLISYWLLLKFGVTEKPYELETNLVRKVDLMILGENNMWKGLGIVFEPEGLLSTISAIVSVIFGYVVGWRIKTAKNKDVLVKELLLYGFLALFLGWFWDKTFPINKSLWTSSYVLYTTGMASVALGICIEIIDIQQQKWFTKPFIVFGTNALFAFIFSGVLFRLLYYSITWKNENGEIIHANNWLYETIYQPIFGDLNGSFLYAFTFVIVCWCTTWILYRNKIFIKI